jgi:hypothetical protein
MMTKVDHLVMTRRERDDRDDDEGGFGGWLDSCESVVGILDPEVRVEGMRRLRRRLLGLMREEQAHQNRNEP